MKTLPQLEEGYNPRSDEFSIRSNKVKSTLQSNGITVKGVYHRGAGETGDPFEDDFFIANPKTGKDLVFTLKEHFSLTLRINGKKIKFPR